MQEVSVDYGNNGISSSETSDAIASVLPAEEGAQVDPNMMEFIEEQVRSKIFSCRVPSLDLKSSLPGRN